MTEPQCDGFHAAVFLALRKRRIFIAFYLLPCEKSGVNKWKCDKSGHGQGRLRVPLKNRMQTEHRANYLPSKSPILCCFAVNHVDLRSLLRCRLGNKCARFVNERDE